MAKKDKTVFFCTDCGNESLTWSGQCGACKEWNTLVEAPKDRSTRKRQRSPRPGKKAAMSTASSTHFNATSSTLLSEVPKAENASRILTGIEELDFVLGGGLVEGSITLLGGAPGIGKSTILLQVSGNLRKNDKKVLYVSGEESAQQVRMRAERLGGSSEDVYFLSETNIEGILSQADEVSPQVLVIDSIQTVYSSDVDSAPGQISQVRECAAQLQHYSKSTGCAVLLIGHITKSGNLAGPKILEHIVDTVLQFDPTDELHRLLRATKHRFGSVDEIALFEMTEKGLVAVPNPSEVFLADRNLSGSGSSVTAVMEGSRPLLVEIQGLAATASYGSPQRVSEGFSRKRLAILLAVLEKRANIPFQRWDVFLNAVGGVMVDETAADAAVVVALASSVFDKPARETDLFLGEVGLGGELRRVGHVQRRLAEAKQLGFKRVFLPAKSAANVNGNGMEVVGVNHVKDLLEKALETNLPTKKSFKSEKVRTPTRPNTKSSGGKKSRRVEMDLGEQKSLDD